VQDSQNDKYFGEPKVKSLFENEEEILGFWKENKIFEKSLDKNPKDKIFSFYDGPPFITGMPHHATLLPSIAKDIIPRYQTMRGNYVPRVWGWDVHGLPAENKVEERLGLKNRKDIEAFGIKNFVEEARKYVKEGSEQWRWYIDHIGRWADMDHPYRTDDMKYMESVIWIFKQLYDKGLIYKGRRVFLYCTRCATVVSKFETTMDPDTYKDVEDPAMTIAFKLKDEKDTYILAWTTTPWTLPANNAIAVGQDIEYIKISNGEKFYILAREAFSRYPEFQNWKQVESFRGKELDGKSYEPLFEQNVKQGSGKNYKIYLANFATTEEGTGIVHIASGFGEDDFNLGEKKELIALLVLDDDGKFLADAKWPWAGKYFKDANPMIIENLKERGLLVKMGKIIHSYPHCYRCGTPLIYMAQESLLFKIDKIRKQLLKTNKKINWIPEHFGDKRFAYNIESAPDWSLSRTRYWGVPIPIWETEDGEQIVVGSIEEIEKLSGQKVTDLHRPYIDEIIITTPSGKKAHRVKEVLDVWFESGSMPYAQDHYPFENKKKFEAGFPTDFIIEHTGQLRGWFYYLHVLANALKNSIAFRNVAVTGVMWGTDGRKMSKSFGNYPDPRATIEKYGAESLRLYFMGSKIMNGEDLNLSEEEIKENYAILNILHNAYKYFITYANLYNWKPGAKYEPSDNILDKWISARLEQFIFEYTNALDEFKFVDSTRGIRPFIEDLSTWYIRRSRDRFASGDADALKTLHYVLSRFAVSVAPTLPFTADTIYKNLVKNGVESVHLCDYPEANRKLVKKSKDLLKVMETARNVTSIAHSLRAEINQPIRQKLGALIVKNLRELKHNDEILNLIKSEVNVGKVEFDIDGDEKFKCAKIGNTEVCINTELTEELIKDGLLRDLLRQLQDSRKNAGLHVGQKAVLKYQTDDSLLKSLFEENKDLIQKSAHFSEILFKEEEGSSEILNKKVKIKLEL
jgi:isoleucyl-tRNA synthetase